MDAHDLVTGVDGARGGHGGVDSAGQGGQDAHEGLLQASGEPLLRPWQATAGRPRRGNRKNPGDLVVPGIDGAEEGAVMPDEYAIGACGFSQTLCDQC